MRKDWKDLVRSVQFTLDRESIEKLDRLSYEMRKSRSELIREMIKRYFSEEKGDEKHGSL